MNAANLRKRKRKTIHDWVIKRIHVELLKKFKFVHANKSYMFNSESVQENETHMILWDFKIPTRLLIQRRVDFDVSANQIENKIKRKHFYPARELKSMEHEGNVDTSFNCYTRNNPQKFGKWTRKLRNQRMSGDHRNYNMIKIGQNTDRSPLDLRRLSITQAPMKDHQLTLVWKTHEE